MAGKNKAAVELVAKTSAYETAMKNAKKKTKDFGDAANDAKNKTKGFGDNLRIAARNTAVMEGPLGGVAGRMSALATVINSTGAALAAFAVASTAAVLVTYKSITAYADYESQVLRLEAVIKATGGAAGLTADQMDDLAKSTARATLTNAAAARNAIAALASFKSIAGVNFKETIKQAQNLAATFGTDLRSSAIQLGKALEDPRLGLVALRRSGISFSESERDLIIAMYDAGNAADGQRLILKKLQEQVGGAGAAAGGGLAGSIDLLSDNWVELLETIGKTSGAASAAGFIFDTMAKGAARLNKMLSETGGEKSIRLFNELFKAREKAAQGGLGGRSAALTVKRLEAELKAHSDTEAEKAKIADEAYKKSVETRRVIREQAAADAAKAKKESVDKELVVIRKRNEMIKQATSKAALDLEAAEDARYEKEKIRIEGELERLKNKGLLSAEVQKAITEQKELAEEEHLARTQEIKDKANKKEYEEWYKITDKKRKFNERIEKEQNEKYVNMLSMAKKYLSQKGKLDNAGARITLALANVVFNDEKRKALAKAKVDGELAIQKAWASAAFPYNIPAVALATASVGARVATIAGIAHGGMEDVPREATYLLQKGERVLSPSQNKELMRDIKGGRGTQVTIYNTASNVVDAYTQDTGDGLEIFIDQVKKSMGNDVDRGRGIAINFQRMFNATRIGVI